MNENDLRRRLAELDPPDREAAQQRAWRVVDAAFDGREPAGRRPRRRRAAVLVALAATVVAIAATPAGATVADWVRDVFDPGHRGAAPALVELPAPGRLLATSADGAWVVAEDGSKRRLGPYADATWSPRGLFVAATGGNQLVAVEPDGDVRWALARRGRANDPAWSPDGYRVAYRSGRGLRVVAGDGIGDRRLAPAVAPSPPVWRPSGGHVLAYAEPDGRIAVVAADSGRRLWRTAPGRPPDALVWTRAGRLLALTPDAVRVYGAGGRALRRLAAPAGARLTALALHPRGDSVAVAQDVPAQLRGEVVLRPLDGGPSRRLFSGDGTFSDLAWSPNGRWLLIGWPTADQWVFVRPSAAPKVIATSRVTRSLTPGAPTPRVTATSGVSRQLDPAGGPGAAFPEIRGWCCPRTAR